MEEKKSNGIKTLFLFFAVLFTIPMFFVYLVSPLVVGIADGCLQAVKADNVEAALTDLDVLCDLAEGIIDESDLDCYPISESYAKSVAKNVLDADALRNVFISALREIEEGKEVRIDISSIKEKLRVETDNLREQAYDSIRKEIEGRGASEPEVLERSYQTSLVNDFYKYMGVSGLSELEQKYVGLAAKYPDRMPYESLSQYIDEEWNRAIETLESKELWNFGDVLDEEKLDGKIAEIEKEINDKVTEINNYSGKIGKTVYRCFAEENYLRKLYFEFTISSLLILLALYFFRKNGFKVLGVFVLLGSLFCLLVTTAMSKGPMHDVLLENMTRTLDSGQRTASEYSAIKSLADVSIRLFVDARDRVRSYGLYSLVLALILLAIGIGIGMIEKKKSESVFD